MMILWIVVIAAIVWLVWTLAQRGPNGDGRSGLGPRGDAAEEVLRERYARGEIDDETYRRMLDELRRSR